MNTIATIIGIAVGLTSIASFVAVVVAYIKTAAVKKYAAEDAMKEIRVSLRELEKAIDLTTRTTEFQFQTVLTKLSEVNTRIDSVTITKYDKYEEK